jgi:PHS family inorganic phosphate transporter-like MFS transporter
MLIMWRLFLGIGIGGDYPLSAIITSEFANTKNRGGLMAAVFAMQGFGILTGSIISLIVLSIFKSEIENPVTSIQYIDVSWRLLIGFGAIPGVVAIYFRLTIPESPRYTMDVKGNT